MELRANGGLTFSLMLTIDAMSVVLSIKACAVMMPTEKSVACHRLWLRQLLDNAQRALKACPS